MNKNGITSNDILEALSIRVNDILRPNSKRQTKKNNIFFWIFKFIFLLLFIILIAWFFNQLRGLGVSIIYFVGKSLRSVLSAIWIVVIDFMKELLIIYLLYDNFKIFISSEYYENLYSKERKMKKQKEGIVKVINIIFKIISVGFLIITGFIAALALFFAVYLTIMFMDGVYLISPIIIMISIFVICYFTFKHVQSRFFDTKVVITKTYFIVSFLVLLAGVMLFGYEISSFEYNNKLPKGFETIKKEQTFKINDNQKIGIKSDSKLDNLKVIIDDNLENEIKIEVEYFETADVKYIYNFNENDDLNLTFTSSLNFETDNVVDVLKLFMSCFKNKTIYNYNLFKYPNIYVYANKETLDKISIK